MTDFGDTFNILTRTSKTPGMLNLLSSLLLKNEKQATRTHSEGYSKPIR